MGTQNDIIFSYDDIDELWRLSLGEHADITAAFYNDDYQKSLEQAQHDKHNWILNGIGFKPGFRILDIGCGWGPMLKAIKKRGGDELGLTLSLKQAKTCKQHNLNVLLQDWKNIKPIEHGKFDAIVSIGAFEHFCSVEEYLAGRRDSIYDHFFRMCFDLLVEQGMLFLQTMTWGQKTPWAQREPTEEDINCCSLQAPYKSDEWVLASIRSFFPGSWIPRNLDHLKTLASPHFEFVNSSDGRLDYVQTVTEWEKKWHYPQHGKQSARLKLLLRYIFGGSAYRSKLQCLKENNIREVFIRDLFGHQRIFFKKKSTISTVSSNTSE